MENLFEINKKRLAKNLQASYIQKGKKANIGEIREWQGKKYQKQADGKWKEYKSNLPELGGNFAINFDFLENGNLRGVLVKKQDGFYLKTEKGESKINNQKKAEKSFFESQKNSVETAIKSGFYVKLMNENRATKEEIKKVISNFGIEIPNFLKTNNLKEKSGKMDLMPGEALFLLQNVSFEKDSSGKFIGKIKGGKFLNQKGDGASKEDYHDAGSFSKYEVENLKESWDRISSKSLQVRK